MFSYQIRMNRVNIHNFIWIFILFFFFFFNIVLHANLLHTIVYSAVFVHCNTDLLLETLFGWHSRIQSDAKYVVCNRNLKILFFDEVHDELIIQVWRKTKLAIVIYKLFNFWQFVRAAFHWSWWTAACFSPATKNKYISIEKI